MPDEKVEEVDETNVFVLDAFQNMGEDENISSGEKVEVAAPNAEVKDAKKEVVLTAKVEEKKEEVAAPVAKVGEAEKSAGVVAASEASVVAQEVAPTRSVDSFAALQAELVKNEEVFTKVLAEQVYKLSEKEVEEIFSGDASSISRLAAKVQVQTVSSVLTTISKQLPQMVFGLLQARQMNNDREKQFWDANGHLDASKHREAVLQIARLYKQSNPKVEAAKANQMIGMLVAAQLGIPMQAVAQGAASAVRTPGKVVKKVDDPSYTPAGINAGNGGGKSSVNEWDQLAKMMQADQQGAFDF